MKGRHTSFQRFGTGSHNPFGSVLNKYLRTSDDREGDIYKTTATKAAKVNLSFERIHENDLGEEVYGCLSYGIGKTKYPEYNYKLSEYDTYITDNRRKRKDVQQYSKLQALKTWKQPNNKTATDYSLIAQENIPINACAKYPIKFESTDYDGTPISVDVDGGAGFSGPYLYRPSKFGEGTNKAIKEDAIVNSFPVSSITIPTGIAHNILNCTKKISISGSFSHESKRKTIKCSGPSARTVVSTFYYGEGSSCSWKWKAASNTYSYECISPQENISATVRGGLEGSMSRYKAMSSLWNGEPTQLDLSPNYLIGSNTPNALRHSAITELWDCFCSPYEYNQCPDSSLYSKAKLLGERQIVEKLDAGCAVVPSLDIDLIRRNQEDNLLSENLKDERCDSTFNTGGILAKYLSPLAFEPFGYSGVDSAFGYSGVDSGAFSGSKGFVSGPSLSASYVESLYEFVGENGDEKVYKDSPCGKYDGTGPGNYEVFKSPAAEPIQTALRLVRDGSECPLYDSMRKYDYRAYPGQLLGRDPNCGDYCSTQGTWGFPCEYSKQCYEVDGWGEVILYPHNSGSDFSKATSGCSVPYRIDLHIANYVDTNGAVAGTTPSHYLESPMPLSIYANEGDDHTINIGFIFRGTQNILQSRANTASIYGAEYDINSPVFELPVISTCKAWHESNIISSTAFVKEAGTLTLKNKDWSKDIPLWTIHDPKQKGECAGGWADGSGGPNMFYVDRPAQVDGCIASGDPCKDFAGKVGGSVTDECCRDNCKLAAKRTVTPDLPGPCCGCCCPGNNFHFDLCSCCGCCCLWARDGGCITDKRIPGAFPCPTNDAGAQPPSTTTGQGELGCFGEAQDLEELNTELKITLTFENFTKIGG